MYSLKILLKTKNREMSNLPYTLNPSNLSLIKKAYGQWLSLYPWTHIATMRRNCPFPEIYCHTLSKHFRKNLPNIEKAFMAIEYDRSALEYPRTDRMNHIHLLILAPLGLNKTELVRGANYKRNPKVFNYFQPVFNIEEVSYYCTKNMNGRLIAHDIFVR